MQDFLRFFITKSFWKNFLLSVGVFSILIYGVLIFLDNYTRHGESVDVPNFIGLHFSEIENFAKENNVSLKVIDTLFFDDEAKGIILKQNPESFYINNETQDTVIRKVKENRKIYLTINALVPPSTPVPVKEHQSYRIAKQNLTSRNIKISKISYVPSNCTDCVLKIKYRGKEIPFGSRVPEGAAIELVLGMESKETTTVPRLIGLSLEVAKKTLSNKTLTLGVAQYDDCRTKQDSLNAIIFDQNPTYLDSDEIRKGSSINVWLKNP